MKDINLIVIGGRAGNSASRSTFIQWRHDSLPGRPRRDQVSGRSMGFIKFLRCRSAERCDLQIFVLSRSVAI